MNRPMILGLIGIGLVAGQCWFSDLAPSLSNRQITEADKTRCEDKSKRGRSIKECLINVRCNAGTLTNPGYYFQYDYDGQGVNVLCNGNSWVLTNRDPVPDCKKGCVALDNSAMANATFYDNTEPKRFWTNGGMKLWPLGTVIETKCKPGYYFIVSKTHQQKGYDEHNCTGAAGSGWTDLNKDQDYPGYAWPAYCRGYCEPISNLPDGVTITQDPNKSSQTNAGKPVLPVGAKYVLKCKEGYHEKTSIHPNDTQELICDGKWKDVRTGKQPFDMIECVAQGCPAITPSSLPNHSSSNEEGSTCGDVKGDGCRVTIHCNKRETSTIGYYMPGKPSGYQLTCSKGVWYDDTNATIQVNGQGKYPGKCEAGCIGLSDDEKRRANVTGEPTNTGNPNEEVMVYPIGTQITTFCKEGYIRPGINPQGEVAFNCEATGWKATIDDLANQKIVPGTCVPACEVKAGGTDYTITGAQYLLGNTTWVPKGATISRKCKTDYKPNGNQVSPQELICEGGDSAWRDPKTNETNEIPLQCIPDGAPGCPDVPTGSRVNYMKSLNCTLVDGLLNKGCVLTLTCKDGYFPDGEYNVVNETGEQKLVCTAGNNGYTNLNSNTNNAAILKCTEACAYPQDYAAAIIITPANSGDFFAGTYKGMRYLKPGGTLTTTCKSLKDGYYYNNEGDKNRAEASPPVTNYEHICRGGQAKYTKKIPEPGFPIDYVMPGDMCGAVCKQLPGLETTTVYNMGIKGSSTFTTEGVRYAVGVEYLITCKDHYQFPIGSDASRNGQQRLLCVGGTVDYKDVDTGKTMATVTYCQKAPEPRCPLLDTSTLKTTWTTVSGDCTPQSGTVAAGCVIAVNCQNGYFPTGTVVSQYANSTLQCKRFSNNTAIWVDNISGNTIPPLTCIDGCLKAPTSDSYRIVQDDNYTTIGGVAYYPIGSKITVVCNPGYMPFDRSAYEGLATGLSFKCIGGNAESPWQPCGEGAKMQSRERGPFGICIKYCTPPIDPDLYAGVVDWRAPNARVLDDGTRYVSGEGVYELRCRAGFSYKPPRNGDHQMIVCNGATGQYMEIANGGLNKTNPTVQTCSTIEGPGCSSPVTPNASPTLSCSPNPKYEKGCTATVTCNEGFGSADLRYNRTGKQTLQCKDGYDWYDESGNIVNSNNTMGCVAVCKAEVTRTSTVQNSTSITIMMGETKYIPVGGEIVVTCTGDGVIWISDSSQTSQSHRYKCVGGSPPYSVENSLSNGRQTIPGEGCVGTCPVFANLDDLTFMTKVPQIITWQGQNLVANNDKYIFTCATGYQRSDPSTAVAEEARCDGTTRSYVNPVTNAHFAVPSKCVPIQTGCQDITYNNTHITLEKQMCNQTNGFSDVGCSLFFRCESNYRPNVTTYDTKDGSRTLQCKKLLGKYVWVDKDINLQYTDAQPLFCISGCDNTTNNTKPPYSQTFYSFQSWQATKPDGSPAIKGSKAICYKKDQYNGGTYTPHYYSCPVTPDYYNNFCAGSCRALQTPFPAGLIALQEPKKLAEYLDYIYATTWYYFLCDSGWEFQDPTYKAIGYQQMLCNNDSTYTDVSINKINSTTLAKCVQKQGCTKLSQGPNVAVFSSSSSSSCSVQTSTFAQGCALTYQCQTGSSPVDPGYLYAGTQEVICTKDTTVWNITNAPYAGNTASSALECQGGCSQLNMTVVNSIATVVKITIDSQDFPSTKGHSGVLSCVSVNSRTDINTIINKMNLGLSKNYFCANAKDSFGQLFLDDKNLCPNTCLSLTFTQTQGLQLTRPAEFQPYQKTTYVKVGASYTFKCDTGYDLVYPAGTTRTDPVPFTCMSDGGIKDNSQLTFDPSKPPQCVKKPQTTCDKPSKPFVEINYDLSTCGADATIASSGCVMTAKCANGSHPTNYAYLSKSTFEYQCSTTNSGDPVTWRNISNPSQTFDLACEEGCVKTSEVSNTAGAQTNLRVSNAPYQISCFAKENEMDFVITDDIKRYFCPPPTGVSITEVANYNCTGACLIYRPDNSSGIAYSLDRANSMVNNIFTLKLSGGNDKWIPLPVVSYPNKTATFTCPPGKKFVATNTNVRSLTCDADLQYRENNQVVVDVGPCA